MKKQVLACFSMLLCMSTAYSQPQKGRMLLGANFGGSSSVYEGSNNLNSTISPKAWKHVSSSFRIGPSIDYFISNKASLGIELGYQYGKNSYKYIQPDSTHYERSSHTFSTALSHTQYFLLKGPLCLGLKNSLYGSVTEKKEPFNYSGKDLLETSTGLGYRLHIGLTYFVSNRLVLDTYVNLLDVSYSRSKSSYQGIDYSPSGGYVYNDKRTKSQSFTVSGINNFNMSSLSVGVHYYLGQKLDIQGAN